MLRRGMVAVVDLVFPLRCAGCRTLGSWFCGDCAARLHAPRPARCLACGRFSTVSPCPLCPATSQGAEALVAMARLQGPGREALHRLKYGDRPQLARALVAALVQRWADLPVPTREAVESPADLLAVPLHATRMRSRGYNQAEELALALAAAMGRTYIEGLVRTDPGPSQVGRGGEDRRRDLGSAFAWAGVGPPPRDVLLVDDVTTTGSTLQACARVLRAAGARSVKAVAVMQG